MSSTQFAENIITMIEELYCVERSEEEWLDGVLGKAREFLDRGAGVGGVLYDLAPDENLHVRRFVAAAVPDCWLKVGKLMHSAPEFARDHERVYRTLQCATLQECIRDSPSADVAAELYRNEGVAGVTLINGLSPDGEGCALYIFSPQSDHLSDKKRELLRRLSSHIATANRLRCRLKQSGRQPIPTTADAVLSSCEKVEHAHGAAGSDESRENIRRAFAAREWARGSARIDPERASLVWKGLVHARWSLIDYLESDGKRYVLAQENSIAVAGLTIFTARERACLALALQGRANKSIAYELGLANATVRVLMARAAQKAGARSRRELLQKCHALRGEANLIGSKAGR